MGSRNGPMIEDSTDEKNGSGNIFCRWQFPPFSTIRALKVPYFSFLPVQN
jgi:hypothetical protein